jgi:hypothetical protein
MFLHYSITPFRSGYKVALAGKVFGCAHLPPGLIARSRFRIVAGKGRDHLVQHLLSMCAPFVVVKLPGGAARAGRPPWLPACSEHEDLERF